MDLTAQLDAIRQLGPIAWAAKPKPLALAEQVFEAFCHNGYGVFDDVIQQLGEQPVPVPPKQEWQQVSYGSGGPTYAHERAEIAECLLAAGPSEDALDLLTRATPDRSRWPEMTWEHTHIAPLQVLGRVQGMNSSS
jgi:hypothetical protein